MNIFGEFIRVWENDPRACKLCPPEKVFTGRVPDTVQDPKTGQTVKVEAPFVSLRYIDGVDDGGTTDALSQVHVVQFSAYAAKRIDAEKIRDYAADLFEDCQLKVGGETRQFQDCSLDIPGELPDVDGLFELFQRFNVEVSISRPRRKGSV